LDKGFKLVKKIPGVSYLKKGKKRFILVHDFRGFSSWLLGPIAFGLWQGRLSCLEALGRENCSSYGEREKKREERRREERSGEKRKGLGFQYTLIPFWGISPRT
jgi:hypothetical protein